MASIYYFRLPEEEADLLERLQQDPDVMATPNRLVESASDIVWRPPATAFEDPETSFLITPSRFIPQMEIIKVDSDGVCIDVTTAPALMYVRGQQFTPTKLGVSSVGVKTSYYPRGSNTSRDLPTEYVRWGRRILDWVRRSAPGTYYSKSYRITDKAEAARKAGMQLIR
jgi:hypothetical protein